MKTSSLFLINTIIILVKRCPTHLTHEKIHNILRLRSESFFSKKILKMAILRRSFNKETYNVFIFMHMFHDFLQFCS